jgi:hypothetical protein
MWPPLRLEGAMVVAVVAVVVVVEVVAVAVAKVEVQTRYGFNRFFASSASAINMFIGKWNDTAPR